MAQNIKKEASSIKRRVSDRLKDEIYCEDEKIIKIIEEEVLKETSNIYLSHKEVAALISDTYNSIRGFDVLQPFIENREVDEIMVIGKDKIFTERAGEMRREEASFESEECLLEVISRMVAQANRAVNESRPIVDSRLKDGSRINVVLSPIAIDGSILTIRKFPERPFDLDKLIKFQTLTEEAADFLRKTVRRKYNIFISGGTGTGKTTFLNALSNEIPKNERIVTIEDSAELMLSTVENLVRLEARNANVEGKGAVTVRELIRTALRMRPDRIVVGEVRGSEALDMLQAMNTGHEGSMSTGHANSPRDILYRIETMVLFGAEVPLAAVRQQIASSIDIIVHLDRGNDFKRRVTSICEVGELLHGEIQLNELFAIENLPDGRYYLKKTGELKRKRREVFYGE